jgi:hypothetical protein
MSDAESPDGVNRLYLSHNSPAAGAARVTPEPTPDERAALLAALADESSGLDPWTLAALREAAGEP